MDNTQVFHLIYLDVKAVTKSNFGHSPPSLFNIMFKGLGYIWNRFVPIIKNVINLHPFYIQKVKICFGKLSNIYTGVYDRADHKYSTC